MYGVLALVVPVNEDIKVIAVFGRYGDKLLVAAEIVYKGRVPVRGEGFFLFGFLVDNAAVVGSMVYSLIVAMLLNRKIPARGFFRAVFYLPYVLPAAAVYIGWSWLYNTEWGLFNYILSKLGIERLMFVSSSSQVVPSLALIAVWLSGNLIVIFLAGLQNVPRVYHEAAEIDGANAWQRFWHVTFPSMTPIIFYNMLMSLITNMQVVTPALALTKGGPGKSSYFMSYMLYNYAFKQRGKIGLACAIAFVLFLLIGAFTLLLFATSKSWIFYEGGDDK